MLRYFIVSLSGSFIYLFFYRSPDDIDIFAGALSEQPVFGGLIGPTNACLLANQFRRLKIGDRFFYENPFPSTGFTLRKCTFIFLNILYMYK